MADLEFAGDKRAIAGIRINMLVRHLFSLLLVCMTWRYAVGYG